MKSDNHFQGFDKNYIQMQNKTEAPEHIRALIGSRCYTRGEIARYYHTSISTINKRIEAMKIDYPCLGKLITPRQVFPQAVAIIFNELGIDKQSFNDFFKSKNKKI